MKILLAIDGSNHSEATLQALLRQFRPEGTEVRVLGVVAPPSLSTPPQMDERFLPELADQLKQAKELLEAFAKRLRAAGFETTTSTPVGDIRNVIIESAKEFHADLILMGSHGRKGIGRFLLGSVAESVVRHAHCSVEVVRIPPAS